MPMPVSHVISILFSRRMLIILAMGFASGLPLMLTQSVLQVWMREEGVDLSTIGAFALLGLPYTLKFLWAPFLDRFSIIGLGRRRGWLLLAQIGLVAGIASLGLFNPKESPWLVAYLALWVTFLSATQDIVIDAYRREYLPEQELGLGSGLYVNGYRFAMLLASGGGLIIADLTSFKTLYFIMASCMLIGVITTLLAPEPNHDIRAPQSLQEAVIKPFQDYFSRHNALIILIFILLYKLGDTLASAMSSAFYIDMGFSKIEIGEIVKLFGFVATVVGAFIGGLLIIRLGNYRALWLFGILQLVSTAGFSVLAYLGHNLSALAAVISFENLASGMGTAAFMAFMASLTNKQFTATQYALLSSLMGVPRVILAAPTGLLAEQLGWVSFFIVCTVIAIPGLLLIRKVASRN